jgi:hypothetical protein
MRGRRNRRYRRGPPPNVPGAELYVEIAKALSNVERNVRSGGFNGRPDLVDKAFKELDELNCAAYGTFCELQWALHTHVQAVWGKLWKRDAKK